MDFSATQRLNSPTLSSVLSKEREFTGYGASRAVTFEEALVVVNDSVFTKKGKYLSEAEIIVLKGAWNNDDYEEMASDSPYSLNYLQRRIAPHLWDLLSETLGNGERVSKKKLRHILLEEVAKKYPQLTSIRELAPVDNHLIKVLGGQLPDISSFYGRTQEVTFLKELVNNQRCIALTGVAGIGKSALAAKLILELGIADQPRFDYFIWKSVSHAPLLQDLIADLIELVQPIESRSGKPEYTQAMITMLLKQLQLHRCLIVLDESEALFQMSNSEQRLDYKLFFRRLVEEQHQSCLLLTSRTWPNEFDALIEADRPIEHFRIEGLDQDAAMQFLYTLGLDNQDNCCTQLIKIYRGNPSELKFLANRIHRFFASSAKMFFKNQTTFLSIRFQEMLNEFFGEELTKIQRQIMIFLAERIALNSEFTDFDFLLIGLNESREACISTSDLIIALENLEKQSLVETFQDPTTKKISFTLQPVIKKYIEKDPQGLVHVPDTSSNLVIAS
jgi:deoxyadenosine/deoxycytidine kinase